MHDKQIDPKAQIGSGNTFGHGIVIGDGVKIGDNNVFGDYVVLSGNVSIGSRNYFGSYIAIGGLPTNSTIKYEFRQIDSLSEAFGGIDIGNDNVIREFTNIGLPTQESTTIKNGVYIMPHCHIPHDVVLEDNVILSNHCSPGGHTKILEGANLGKGVQTHPRCVIGQCAILGVGTIVIRNVLPAVKAAGNPARFLGVNSIGLERNGYTPQEIEEFGRILTSPTDVTVDKETLSPRVLEVINHFLEVLPESRDARSLPQVTIS